MFSMNRVYTWSRRQGMELLEAIAPAEADPLRPRQVELCAGALSWDELTGGRFR
jgi:hypothetical protein